MSTSHAVTKFDLAFYNHEWLGFLIMILMIIEMIHKLINQIFYPIVLKYVCQIVFVQYYAMFDNNATRGELAKLYNAEQVIFSYSLRNI